MIFDPRIHGWIKAARMEKHLTQEELGELLGMTKQGVRDMERSELHGKISLRRLQRVAKTLGYKVEYKFKRNTYRM